VIQDASPAAGKISPRATADIRLSATGQTADLQAIGGAGGSEPICSHALGCRIQYSAAAAAGRVTRTALASDSGVLHALHGQGMRLRTAESRRCDGIMARASPPRRQEPVERAALVARRPVIREWGGGEIVPRHVNRVNAVCG